MSGLWLSLPLFGPVRTSTLLAAVAMLVIVVAVRRDPLRAVVAVVAWAGVFETVYHTVGIVVDWRLSAVFVALMAVWVATGFHYNVPGQGAAIDIRAEVINESSKTVLALAYLVGTLCAGERAPRPVPEVPATVFEPPTLGLKARPKFRKYTP